MKYFNFFFAIPHNLYMGALSATFKDAIGRNLTLIAIFATLLLDDEKPADEKISEHDVLRIQAIVEVVARSCATGWKRKYTKHEGK